jgi:hypothetical protein
MKEFHIISSRKLLAILREHFKDESDSVRGLFGSGRPTLSVLIERKTEGGITTFKSVSADDISKWTSEDYMYFEKKCKEELK